VPEPNGDDHDVVAIIWSQNNRDHVLAKKFYTFLTFLLTPAFPFCVDLPHANGDLGWAEVCDIDWLESWFTDGNHWMRLHRVRGRFPGVVDIYGRSL
jgi:hypothetical protein